MSLPAVAPSTRTRRAHAMLCSCQSQEKRLCEVEEAASLPGWSFLSSSFLRFDTWASSSSEYQQPSSPLRPRQTAQERWNGRAGSSTSRPRMVSCFLPQTEPSFPCAHPRLRLCDQPLRIAGVNVLLAPARIVISTPWALRSRQMLFKTLQASV